MGAGGSTITQQLIKNVTSDDDVTPVRKLREIFRALQLERDYTKDEILEAYLNIIFLGGRVYGIEAASQQIFRLPRLRTDRPAGGVAGGDDPVAQQPEAGPPSGGKPCPPEQLRPL